jgi:hypothetical protein
VRGGHGATNLSARFAFTYVGACGRFGISRCHVTSGLVKGRGAQIHLGPPESQGNGGVVPRPMKGRVSPSQARESIRSPPEQAPAGGGRCALELLDIGGDPQQRLSDAARRRRRCCSAKTVDLVLVDLAPAAVAGGPRLASTSMPPMTTSGSTRRADHRSRWRFRCPPMFKAVRPTDAGVGVDWEDQQRRKVIKKILSRRECQWVAFRRVWGRRLPAHAPGELRAGVRSARRTSCWPSLGSCAGSWWPFTLPTVGGGPAPLSLDHRLRQARPTARRQLVV